jgi:hypothetical protein
MSNKKQTAVEWLYKELALNNNSIDSIKERIYKESEIVKQAKKMHEQEIVNAYRRGMVNSFEKYVEGSNITITSEQYYNETFNSDEA